jgi:hypothetical protein
MITDVDATPERETRRNSASWWIEAEVIGAHREIEKRGYRWCSNVRTNDAPTSR